MSRARREKKSKVNLKVWVPIICIIVIGIAFYMLHDIQNKIEENRPQNTINAPENQVGNVVNEENNTEENMIQENSTENETTNIAENTNISNNTNPTNSTSAPAKPAVTDQKQKAIELVKKEWGKDDTVDYVFDYINENGEYVVAVKDRATATVKYYFRVNLESGAVELD